MREAYKSLLIESGIYANCNYMHSLHILSNLMKRHCIYLRNPYICACLEMFLLTSIKYCKHSMDGRKVGSSFISKINVW